MPKRKKGKRVVGPPKVGMRSVKGRGGKVTTVRRPSPQQA